MPADEPQPLGTSLELLESFRSGNDAAAESIFARYFQRLIALARSRLSPRLAQRTDPEDVVLSVYRSFFVDVRAGKFMLGRGGDLWRLLAAMTKHKLLRQARHHRADRRSVDREAPLNAASESQAATTRDEPSADEATALADELECVFAQLDTFQRRVFELRLQGAQVAEIAKDTARSERTVRRALNSIREILSKRASDDR
jgi:RNA polymerase sigma factor (sigma-70 family)